MGRIFIVDIDNEKDVENNINTEIQDTETGTIYEKMLKLSMNMYLNDAIHNHKKLIKRDATWFD
jgi:hypothetical protein